jgi:PAS domain S-box-containing protein
VDGSSDLEVPVETAEDLYENAPCGYMSTSHGGLIVRANRTFFLWTGYSPDQVLGRRRFADLLPPSGRIYYETHYAPLLMMQGKVREIALELTCADQSRLPVLINATLARDAQGRPQLIRITVFNATARREYEQELLRERRRAEQATEEKARFIAMVSHEIRSPLSAIVAVRQMLEKTELSPRQQQLVRMLKSSSEGLLELVNNVLDLGRFERGHELLELHEFDLRVLVEASFEAMRARAELKGIALEQSISGEVPQCVVGDALKINQVLTNLLSNALKFTEHGTVRLSVHCEPTGAESVAITFSVSDTGMGIASDRLSNIFEEYAQEAHVRSRYGGTGLGLAISRGLVELHGGELSVQSELGRGSTFRFTLHLKRRHSSAESSTAP